MPEMFEDFLKSDAMIPLEKPYLDDDKELIFIHSHDTLIEKCLGTDENILIRRESLVAFTSEIKFDIAKMGKEFLKLSGPGIVYIESSSDKAGGLSGFLLEP